MKWLILSFIFLTGCNNLGNLTSGKHHDNKQELPDIYTIEGTATIDFQMIQPVRVLDSSIRVWIKQDDEFVELNQYEYGLTSIGVGGGGVWFKHKVSIIGQTIDVQKECSCPEGCEYKIESTLVKN